MKLKADRASLIKALAHIQSVAEKRNTIPILANALIAVRSGKLSFTATDMEIAVVEEVPAATIFIVVDDPGGQPWIQVVPDRYETWTS